MTALETEEDGMNPEKNGETVRLKPAEDRRRSRPAPPPPDSPLLSFADAAAYLRITPAAVRTLVNGRADGSDGELGDLLRSWLVTLSPHRRYIRREPFLAWLREKSGNGSGSSARL